MRWLRHVWRVWQVAWLLMRINPDHVEPGEPADVPEPQIVWMTGLPGLVRWTLWAGSQAQVWCALCAERVEEPN
jgi:hypothetical protein